MSNMKYDINDFKGYYEWFIKEKDYENANKILEVYDKLKTNMYYLCFTGHFSAGKSSLINYFVGENVLPKSPIPTSANIVKLLSGEGSVKIFFKNKPPIIFYEPYDINVIKDYAKDRGTIKEIQLLLKNKYLNASSTLMDTPGIDAADDADKFMTESVLHLIDELFYVMDYNHVQSEVNLYFLQRIAKMKIPIHLVINQIDKHNEKELSFKKYKRNLEQTFEQWRISPDTVHFTSSKVMNHPLNEVEDLKSFIFNKMENHPTISGQISYALDVIIENHKEFLETKYEVKMDQDINFDQLNKGKQIEHRLTLLQNIDQLITKDFTSEMDLTLKNAYIMPASLRDSVEAFLESKQDNFKVGFINSKKKTNQERELRAYQLKEVLQETADSTIEFKLKEKLHSILKDYEVSFDQISESIQNFNIEMTHDLLNSCINKGAKVTGNYVLNYSNDISLAVKKMYRSEFNKLLKRLLSQINEFVRPECHQLTDKLNKMESIKEVIHKQKKNDKALSRKLSEFNSLHFNKKYHIDLDKLIVEKNHATEKEQLKPIQQTKSEHSHSNDVKNNSINQKAMEINETTKMIDKIIASLDKAKGFQRFQEELIKRNRAIKNRELTIALFGTFSAGKSSFSNALFGERILPVSPNPTTAVISRIKPVTTNKAHGTVSITNKSETEIIQDLENITKYITREKRTYNEWIDWLSKSQIAYDNRLPKMYQSYIEALLKGNESQKDYLGVEIEVSLEGFNDYVTDETKACFIKHVDLYYDSPITRKGITIVDTPGADSVNARHTNVAFDYIKDADAIIYVTYYNHAITSGDRDFLMQLGRVKESFDMDKMFFIVNAADLAEDEQELSLVVDYVNNQLIQFGVRDANIFPVSSRNTLLEKLEDSPVNEKMKHFESTFYQFIEEDLLELMIEAVLWDIQRVKQAINEFINSLSYSDLERNKKIESLNTEVEKAEAIIQAKETSAFENRLLERIERQLHFVEERFSIGFNDLFRSFFNPSKINETGKKGRKQIENARNELIEYVGYELLQEMRAVALRVEKQLKLLQKDAYATIQKRLMDLNPMFTLPQLELEKVTTPQFKQAFDTLDLNVFNQSIKKYKNTKTFFAQNGLDIMRTEFFEIMLPFVKGYINENQSLMLSYYTKEWNIVESLVTSKQLSEVNEIVSEYVDILKDTDNLIYLNKLDKDIEKITKMIS